MSDDAAMRARALARAAWPVRKLTLDQEGQDALVGDRSPGELVALVWAITLDAWASSGAPLPTYRRAEMPGRMIRRG